MSEQSPEIQGYCPVGYHLVGEALEGSSEFSSQHEGKLYHFVSADAKAAFDSAPDKYVPAFGGRCAFGVSIEKDFEPCPTNFKVIDEKLYLFLKNEDTDALALWDNEEAKCLENANKNWQSLQSV